MLDALEGWHIVIIVAVAALLFGSGKLPGAARSMGQSLRIFKSELRAGAQEDGVTGTGNVAAAPVVTAAPAMASTAAAGAPAATPASAIAPQAVASPGVYVPSPTPAASAIPAPVPQPADALPGIRQV